jgi:uncharacterized protein (TIGR02271 family)
MGSTVVGLYDEHTTAEKVYRELKKSGIDDSSLHMVSHEQTDLSNWSSGSGNWNKGHFGHDIADRLTSLSVPEADAELYSEGVRRGGTLVVAHVEDSRAERTAEIMNLHKPVDIQTRGTSWRNRGFSGYDRTSTPFTRDQALQEREHIAQEQSVPIVEEEVKVGKREVSRGGVRVHSHVVSTPVEEQISLRDETVDVERRSVNRPLTDADRAFEDRTIEMRETDEEAVVSKEARVTGEVAVRKGAEERTETVRDTVRKTEVEVEELAGERTTGAAGFDSVSNEFRSHSKTSYGSDAWNTYEPAYRWGYTSGGHDRYRGRDFSSAEPDLRRDYEERHGSGTWDQVKGAVRHAFDRARR